MSSEDTEQISYKEPQCFSCESLLLQARLPDPPFPYEPIRQFQCVVCGLKRSGDRWWCDLCSNSDICHECLPASSIYNHTTQPRNFAARMLHEISATEKGEGVPSVGIFLTELRNIESLKSRLEILLKDNGVKEYKVGFLKLVPLPGESECVVAHMSPNTAINVRAHEALYKSSSVLGALSSYSPLEKLYFGVRSCDPIFGGNILKSTGNHFLDLSPSPTLPTGMSKARFTFAEFFAGISGFRIGLEPLGGRCVFTSEINPAARATAALNFAPTGCCGDITGVYAHQMPDFDILVAGFPCQSFSIRGKQAGLEDSRGQLFRELIRTLKVKRPQAFMFENVAGLVYLNGGRQNKSGEPISIDIGSTFKYILQEFENVGYNVTWKIIDAKHWVPQKRLRVYIVGFRSDLGYSGNAHWPTAGESTVGPGSALFVRHILEREPTAVVQLTQAQWDKIQTPVYLEKTNTWKGLVGGVRMKEIFLDEKAPTLVSGYRNHANEASKFIFEELDGVRRVLPRFLTPRECCRIMGFPDSFIIPHETVSKKGKKTSGAQSESQFYHQIGNAVCPPVVQDICIGMLNVLSL